MTPKKPPNFYDVGDVQVRVFEHHVALWMQMGEAWVKRVVPMEDVDGMRMIPAYELVNRQGVHLRIDIEGRHIPEDIRAKMDATLKKAHVLWLLHGK